MGKPTTDLKWCLGSILLLAGLIAIDAVTDSVVLNGTFAVAAIVAAFRCDPEQTSTVAVLAMLAAIASAVATDMLGDDQTLVRIAVTAVVAMLAVVISRLRTNAVAALEHQRLLARTGEVLAAPLELGARIDQVTQMAVPQLADWCAIDMRSGDGIKRVAVAHSDPEKVDLGFELFRRWPPKLDDPGGVGAVLRTGEPLHYADFGDAQLRELATDDEHFEMLRSVGARSAMVLPLAARGNTFGALALVLDGSARTFRTPDIELAREIARRCGEALEAAALYEQAEAAGRELASLLTAEREARLLAERAEARSDLLAEAGAIFESPLDEAGTLRLLAELLVGWRADDCTAVVLRGQAGVIPPILAASDPERLAGMLEREREHPLATRHDDPVRQTLRGGAPALVERDDGSILAVEPLRARGRTIGALAVTFDTPGRDRRENLAVVADLARRTGMALDNARLYVERSHVARTLQRSLLPAELPDLPGIELAARYRAAGEGNEVGGDFYDCFPVGDDEWAVVVGDVCGKGAEAATITALARYTIRASVLHTRRPAEILAELNEAIRRQDLEYRFCTVLYAALRPTPSGGLAVSMATGGHPPALVLRSNGTVEEVTRSGTLIGIVPDPELAEDDVMLAAGDALVLYTDGVIEASPIDDAFGPEQFARLTASLAGQDASAMASAIESRVLAVQAGQLRDDIAIVIVRLPAGDAPADGPLAFAAEPARRG